MEQKAGGRHKATIRSPGIDELYQQAFEAEEVRRLIVNTHAVSDALCHLIDHAEPGGEVEALLSRHLGNSVAKSDHLFREAELAADVRDFYRRLTESQKRLMHTAFADMHHVGSGVTLGTTRDGPFCRLVDTVDRERKAS